MAVAVLCYLHLSAHAYMVQTRAVLVRKGSVQGTASGGSRTCGTLKRLLIPLAGRDQG